MLGIGFNENVAAGFASSSRQEHVVPFQPITKTTSFWKRKQQHYRHQESIISTTSSSSSSLCLSLNSIPRGGGTVTAAAVATSSNLFSNLLSPSTPLAFFNTALVSLALCTTTIKIIQQQQQSSSKTDETTEQQEQPKKPINVKSLQKRFLIVFWLLRCADWLQGPYFYQVYASKVSDASAADGGVGFISRLFLTGFASTALFGPIVGRATDAHGRKKATLAFCLVYALGALSTKSNGLAILLLGRILSGIGTSLLFSAPESWLVGEAQKQDQQEDNNGQSASSYLGETFGLAYAGDAIVAILAGQFAGAAASARGPTGPFELSTAFLALGGILTALLWKENVATTTKQQGNDDDASSSNVSIRDAVKLVRQDYRILLVGAVQSLFEAAMYIFVLQWPPAMSGAISNAFSGGAAKTPFGTVFSCFMACCLLGSTLFQWATQRINNAAKKNNNKSSFSIEGLVSIMLTCATLAMGGATLAVNRAAFPLWAVVSAFFVFEACVGMYFPSIGTLRSKYVPDSHRSVIMNLFGIPLNVLVVSVFLSMKYLGLVGALSVSTGALGLATLCMFALERSINKKTKNAAAAAVAA